MSEFETGCAAHSWPTTAEPFCPVCLVEDNVRLRQSNKQLFNALQGILSEAENYESRGGKITGKLAEWIEQAEKAITNAKGE